MMVVIVGMVMVVMMVVMVVLGIVRIVVVIRELNFAPGRRLLGPHGVVGAHHRNGVRNWS